MKSETDEGGPVGIERCLSLLTLLLNKPLTTKQIAEALPNSYPKLTDSSSSTGRRNFEKDVADLKALGYSVREESIQRRGGRITRYSVDKENSPANVRFSADQAIALSRLVQYMWLGSEAQDDLADAVDADADERTAALHVHAPTELATVWRAQLTGGSISFRHARQKRTLVDVALTFDDQWRVTGWDTTSEGFRTFPLATITDVKLGSVERPPADKRSAETGSAPLDWPLDPPCMAELRVADGHLSDALRTLRSPQNEPELVHGLLRVRVMNREAFVRAVLQLGPHVVLVGPADLRAQLIERLRAWGNDGAS